MAATFSSTASPMFSGSSSGTTGNTVPVVPPKPEVRSQGWRTLNLYYLYLRFQARQQRNFNSYPRFWLDNQRDNLEYCTTNWKWKIQYGDLWTGCTYISASRQYSNEIPTVSPRFQAPVVLWNRWKYRTTKTEMGSPTWPPLHREFSYQLPSKWGWKNPSPFLDVHIGLPAL